MIRASQNMAIKATWGCWKCQEMNVSGKTYGCDDHQSQSCITKEEETY